MCWWSWLWRHSQRRKNGMYPNNADKEIFYEDQNSGVCDYSNHCPSDKNTQKWLPLLKSAKENLEQK
jgi:hypothetical protein